MTSRRKFLALSLVVLVTLAGCSGMGGNDAGKDGSGSRKGDAGGKSQADSTAATGNQRSALTVQRRALVRTGNVTLQVESFDRTNTNLSRVAREHGGFVSDSTQRVHRNGNETWTTGKIVFRIPAEKFSTFFQEARRVGRVEKASTGTKDVSDRLVDIEARLTNLRSQRGKLRDLYQNASDTEGVLAVEKRLSNVQSEIERLEAKKQSLEGRVAYSTITVRINEPRPPSETRTAGQKSWYDTSVLAAFLESVDGSLVVLRAVIVGVAYLLPYVAVLSLPVGGMFVWRRRNSKNRQFTGDEVVDDETTTDESDD
ncbi:DUF4349 domain-containing protein [Haladaptatus caseinilyticus]|uniref:DUF4349 domain-containing protein n=1 Tax=Haladaptatus caseinilyticus TaxID=2993314 RepID=UPI00224A4982|nr:DUF4349 domain-containing protein [Haladaptatus caseinilyticus]